MSKQIKNKTTPESAIGLPRDTSFIGPNRQISIAGQSLSSPLIYCCPTRGPQGGWHLPPHVFALDQQVSYSGPQGKISYWPGYSVISPRARGNLLCWLAEGKTGKNIDIGLIFIYFYGLEFRAIAEGKDHKLILWEVLRLHKLFSPHSSFGKYAEDFLSWLILSIPHFTGAEKSQIARCIPQLGPDSSLYQSGAAIRLESEPGELLFRNLWVSSQPPSVREAFLKRTRALRGALSKNIKSLPILYHYQCASSVSALNQLSYATGYRLQTSRTLEQHLIQMRKACAALPVGY